MNTIIFTLIDDQIQLIISKRFILKCLSFNICLNEVWNANGGGWLSQNQNKSDASMRMLLHNGQW